MHEKGPSLSKYVNTCDMVGVVDLRSKSICHLDSGSALKYYNTRRILNEKRKQLSI